MRNNSKEKHLINLDKLRGNFIPLENYIFIHQNMVIPTHDVFIYYEGGIILAKRKDHPGRGELWPIGGRINRGVMTEISLQKKVKEECGLEINNIRDLGWERIFFETSPFGTEKGTDNLSLLFIADGKGEIKLDNSLESFIIVTKQNYEEIKERLPPLINKYLNKIIETL